LIGVLIAIAGQIVDCRFDKSTGQMRIKSFGILSRSLIQHNLREIEQVEITETSKSDTTSYQIQIRLKQGETLPLSFTSTTRQAETTALAEEINQFLRSI
jgi:hypothetical protein